MYSGSTYKDEDGLGLTITKSGYNYTLRDRKDNVSYFTNGMLSYMQDANGNRINIASSEVVPQDLTGISMNVDNFQEAYDFLLERGFVNPRGDKVTDTSSSKSTSVHAPSGFFIAVTEHLKNRD